MTFLQVTQTISQKQSHELNFADFNKSPSKTGIVSLSTGSTIH